VTLYIIKIIIYKIKYNIIITCCYDIHVHIHKILQYICIILYIINYILFFMSILLLCNKIIIIIYQYFLLCCLISKCCAFGRETQDSRESLPYKDWGIWKHSESLRFIYLTIFINARRSLAVPSFKFRISDYWLVRMIIVPVLLKEFEGLLRKYEFEIQPKTFIIKILSLYFLDVFRFLQYS